MTASLVLSSVTRSAARSQSSLVFKKAKKCHTSVVVTTSLPCVMVSNRVYNTLMARSSFLHMGILWMCIVRVETDGFLGIVSARKYKTRNAIPTAKIAGISVRLVTCLVADRKLMGGSFVMLMT